MAMTKSLEDYLEAIHCRIRSAGGARVVDIAHVLGVKMPSVNKAVRELSALGLIKHMPYQQLHLTAGGKRLAEAIYRRHTMLKAFLLAIGVSAEKAESDACAMEHVLSEETLKRLAEATRRMQAEKTRLRK
jgi:DtxR family transcriptional regulator, Mn-dependent transcriptional regulator